MLAANVLGLRNATSGSARLCARAERHPSIAAPATSVTRSRRLTSLGGGHLRRLALGLQLQQGAAVVLRHDLRKTGERIVPVFQDRARPRAACEDEMAIAQD